MQALALWDVGVKRWNEKRAGRSPREKCPGVTVNRRDLFAIPHPSAVHLWRDLRVRDVRRVDGRARTNNVRIDLVVEGSTSRAIAFGNFAEARRQHTHAPFRALTPPPCPRGEVG